MLLLALACAVILSQCMHRAVTSLGHTEMSSKKFLSHFASSTALSSAINSDSIIEHAIHVCLEDFQETVAPPKVNTYPLVDLVSILSKIQLASL